MSATSRGLVIVRAGDRSLHPGWTKHRPDRRWDLVVSYFGSDPDLYRNGGDPRIDDLGQKWEGLHTLLTRTGFWRDYDWIWLPDDDLAADEATVDRLFEAMATWQLALAQPALSWASYYSHAITLHHPSFAVRITNFVEIMAPCFSRAALERCLSTFTATLSGWGLDFVWPTLLAPGERAGIVDAATVTHTRPVGGPSYARLRREGVAPMAEMRRVLAAHGLPPDIVAEVNGAITREGESFDAASRDAASPEGATRAARLHHLLARDQLGFRLARLVRAVPASPSTLETDLVRGGVRWRQ